ncbi:MAG: hypothetical protein HOJ79_07435 [Nitrospina sp.]|jgi:hypothetical protein|nr:hypothetical protein [Nitrospina sp.]
MKSSYFSSSIILVILFLFPTAQIFAHGGGHEPEKKKTEIVTPPITDPMYSVKEDEADPLMGSGDSQMFSPSDLFTQDELVSPMPDMEMEGSHNEHAEHQEAQVELSHHERVSFSSKGFGVAVGITLFAGVVFAGLTFRRPGE